MFITYAVVAALMSMVLLASAGAKFTRPKRLVDQMSTLGLPYGMLPFLGIAQAAGAGGLVVGLWWGPLGIAAAVCLALYFIGAVATHLRVGDYEGAPPAAVLTAVAVALVVLRSATL
ncbi:MULTISPECIES: DoxX family protein [unclassified Streptomyces]|uniref:DoxX family protein n=1 Tax=Streptomyces TaxID=1883 RepID=UPI0001C1CF55|nr:MULTISPECIES: DoxX family protein [unclassified Streptomyces]AEN11600.1 putative integral membrane protein [Streptomyces sp. SirexAA-E]MYR66486.1 DoxX family protein [Streptomyces sp. SID4939]MYS04547.1 DoxX family protein [Streptomyces sp. SID4940]MYT61878.1 DoxX family protein [Streptomyces sp. SID8357]MYT85248.1 DoxX family protein [Streptomyces sp. SID8360]